MLQGLFDEEGGDGECKSIKSMKIEIFICEYLVGYQITSSSGSKSTIEKPPAPRNETNLSGLQNQGATWYA